MRISATPMSGRLTIYAALAALALTAAPAARANTLVYDVVLDGVSESPPNASPGTGLATVTIDDVALTMTVNLNFSGLLGTTTASHIHAATAIAGTGTAGVATTTPYFAGFPIGVTAGSYLNTLDLTLASSYNPSFVTAHTDVPTARAFLLASIAAGTAYLNIHTTVVPGGEIRGFLTPANPTPASGSTWGRMKALYK